MERLFDELVIMATNERLDNILDKYKGFLEVQEKAARAATSGAALAFNSSGYSIIPNCIAILFITIAINSSDTFPLYSLILFLSTA